MVVVGWRRNDEGVNKRKHELMVDLEDENGRKESHELGQILLYAPW